MKIYKKDWHELSKLKTLVSGYHQSKKLKETQRTQIYIAILVAFQEGPLS